MSEPMRNDEQYHRGPCPVPTPTERERARRRLAEMRERLSDDDEESPATVPPS